MNYCQTLRWSIFTAGLIALFWTIWSIFAPVPTVVEIKIDSDYSFALPFSISRWWDILLGPIYSCIFIYLFTYIKTIHEDNDLPFSFGLVFGLAPSLIIDIIFIVYGLAFGLSAGLILGLIFCLGVVFKKKLSLAMDLKTGY